MATPDRTTISLSNIPVDNSKYISHRKAKVSPSFGSGKKRGRKPSNVDTVKRVEQIRLSARECRARKKLRYQYVEELVLTREKAIFSLRRELNMLKQWCISLDMGLVPADCISYVTQWSNDELAQSSSTDDAFESPQGTRTDIPDLNHLLDRLN